MHMYIFSNVVVTLYEYYVYKIDLIIQLNIAMVNNHVVICKRCIYS